MRDFAIGASDTRGGPEGVKDAKKKYFCEHRGWTRRGEDKMRELFSILLEATDRIALFF